MWLAVFTVILAVILWLLDRVRWVIFGGREIPYTRDQEIARMEMRGRGRF